MNGYNEHDFTNVCYRITRKCNLKCSFCLASDCKNDLNTEQIKNSIIQLKNNGMKIIRITGGEPTIRNDLIEIIEYCLELNLKVLLYSNLYKIDHIFDDLITLPIIITTSLHGDEQYHNNIIGYNAYKNIYNNIVRLLEKGKLVNIHYVLTSENFIYVEKVIESSIKIGINKITFQTIIPRGSARNSIEYNEKMRLLLKQQLDRIQDLSLKYQNEIKIKVIDFYEKYYYVFEPDGYLYLQKETEIKDEKIKRII